MQNFLNLGYLKLVSEVIIFFFLNFLRLQLIQLYLYLLKFLNERYSIVDNEVIENMINDMAKVVLESQKEEEESEEKITSEVI